MTLADRILELLREEGPLPCRDIARLLGKRKQTVQFELERNESMLFMRSGAMRSSRWHPLDVAPRSPAARGGTFTSRDLAARCRKPRSLIRLVLDGEDGFVERGLVERIGVDLYRVTEAGRTLSAAAATADYRDEEAA